jgi:hypothetical protein
MMAEGGGEGTQPDWDGIEWDDLGWDKGSPCCPTLQQRQPYRTIRYDTIRYDSRFDVTFLASQTQRKKGTTKQS